MDTKRFTVRSEHTRSSIVIAGVITVAIVFAAIGFALSRNTAEQASEPYAGGRLIDTTSEGVSEEICEGMTLAQVWDMWGVPEQVEFDTELHQADYKWFNPFRHVKFATDGPAWRVISHWGYTK